MKLAAVTLSLIVTAGMSAQGIRQAKPPIAEIVLPTIAVYGVSGNAVTLSSRDLQKLPKMTFIDDRGNGARYQAVLLSEVFAKVDVPTGEKFRKATASYYVVAEAKDGYKAVFAWPELDLQFTERPVYLLIGPESLGVDANPTDLYPFAIAVPGDKKRDRWVKQVTSLRIKQAN